MSTTACKQLPDTGVDHDFSARYAGGKQGREQPLTEDHVSLMLLSLVSFAVSAADDERDDSVVVDQSA